MNYVQNMVSALIWSDRAADEYEKLQSYLYQEWGEIITQRVINDITQNITRIQNSPEQFPFFYKTKKIRRCVVSPQTSIFFRFTSERIEIASIFDNRQNPKKLRKLK